MPDDPQSDHEAAVVIRELTKLSRNLTELEVPVEAATAVAVGLGWWMRSIRTAGGIRLLYKSGLSQEASPMLRTLLIHAAAIEWLRRHPAEVLAAVSYEHDDYRQKLYQHGVKRDWDLKKVKLGPPPRGDKPVGLKYLKDVEDLCERIEAEHLYVAYKIESPYSHPSALSADTYWEPSPVEDGMPELRTTPSVGGVPLHVTATFALCATDSLGTLGKLDRLTAAANRLAGRLGVSDQLTARDDDSGEVAVD